MAVIGIPRDARGLAVSITVSDARDAADFYARAFGAAEVARYVVPRAPAGVSPIKAVHLRIGDAIVHVSSANPRATGAFGPKPADALDGFASVLTLFVDDLEASLARAVVAGATEMAPAQDSFWGDRVAVIRDPFGHVWGLAQVMEEISVDEHNRRWAEASKRGEAPRLELPVNDPPG